MTLSIAVVFGLILLALILFATEKVPFDLVALIILAALLLSGILTPSEGLVGFSNEATITIAAMFVLSEGMRRTGALVLAAQFFAEMGQRNEKMAILSLMVIIGVVSAFINNTAAVAIFIPIVLSFSTQTEMSPSRLLMPLSFASMLGGVCTLIGTSTNLLVSSIAEKRGSQPFEMFDFLPLGVIFMLTGIVYLHFFGLRLIPERRVAADLTTGYRMNTYLTDVVLESNCEYIGQPIRGGSLVEENDLDVISVKRKDRELPIWDPQIQFAEGDVVRLRGSATEIRDFVQREGIASRPAKEWYDADLEAVRDTLVEAVVAPESELVARSIRKVDFPGQFGAVVLAIRHRGELQRDDLNDIRLSAGDSILLSMDRGRVEELANDPSFVLVSEFETPSYRRSKMPLALAILAGVVGVAALGLAPIVVTALVGCALMMLTRCLTTEEAYQGINWKVILLLAGILPLGIAMDKTGAAQMLSDSLIGSLGLWGPTAMLSGFFLLSMVLTNVISNQATAVLLAPIAIQTAASLQISDRPFLLAITYAASLSFMTPVGYQTNTLVYGPGHYRFTDFTRVGTPINILFWILATLLIPIFWEF